MIVLASNNSGKIHEMQHFFADSGLEIVSQSKYDVPDVAETGLTFAENAIIKARNTCKYTNLSAIADDSGLVIDALNGGPGIYSARFAGENAASKDNVQKVLDRMKNVPDEKRTARFYCVMVYLRHAYDPVPILCQGVWEGRILAKEQGANGFGYDPIFYLPIHKCSAAELPIEIKNQISHRGQALRKLLTNYLELAPKTHSLGV